MKVSDGVMMFLVCIFAISGVFTAGDVGAGSTGQHTPDGNAVFLASASTGESACSAPVPVLFGAEPGDGQVTITWSDEHTGNPSVTGYNIYYDRDGKSEPVTSVWRQNRYIHAGLTNGQEYCFKVTSLYAECESGFSNVICAVPAAQNP